jgi:hypothetical protein
MVFALYRMDRRIRTGVTKFIVAFRNQSASTPERNAFCCLRTDRSNTYIQNMSGTAMNFSSFHVSEVPCCADARNTCHSLCKSRATSHTCHSLCKSRATSHTCQYLCKSRATSHTCQSLCKSRATSHTCQSLCKSRATSYSSL